MFVIGKLFIMYGTIMVLSMLLICILFAIATDCNTRVEEEPSEARTWVVSSGTENTVFSWSVWRRLPLHEVCFDYATISYYYTLLMYTNKCSHHVHFLLTIIGL